MRRPNCGHPDGDCVLARTLVMRSGRHAADICATRRPLDRISSCAHATHGMLVTQPDSFQPEDQRAGWGA